MGLILLFLTRRAVPCADGLNPFRVINMSYNLDLIDEQNSPKGINMSAMGIAHRYTSSTA